VAAVDKEIAAIKAVLSALEPLSAEARSSVLEYTLKRLSIQIQATPSLQQETSMGPGVGAVRQEQPQHIEQLKDTKKPRSGNMIISTNC